MAVLRRRRLQQRFGPEYDRLIGERDSRRKAEAELTERGYPAGQDQDQVLADLSVAHSDTLDRYRAAVEISGKAAAGTASAEDLRQAMVHYHALFADLLGEPADSDPADQESRPAVAARNTSQQFIASDPEEMAK